MTSPIGRDLLSSLTGEDEYDNPNPALTPLQHSQAVGRALRRVGATPVEKPKPGQPAGFWYNAKTALVNRGKASLKSWTHGAVLPPPGMNPLPNETAARIASQPNAPGSVPDPKGVGGFVGDMAGRMVSPIDLTTSAFTGFAAGPAISKLGGTVARKVGRGLLGKAAGYAAEGAAFGAIENPIANTFHELAGNEPMPTSAGDLLKRRAVDVGAGAAFGAVLDPLARGAWAGTKAVARGFASPGTISQGVKARNWSVFPDPEDAFQLGKKLWAEVKKNADAGEYGLDDFKAFQAWRDEMGANGRWWKNDIDALTAFDDIVDDAPGPSLWNSDKQKDATGEKYGFSFDEAQKAFSDTYEKDALDWYENNVPDKDNITHGDLKKAFKDAGFPDNAGFISRIEDLFVEKGGKLEGVRPKGEFSLINHYRARRDELLKAADDGHEPTRAELEEFQKLEDRIAKMEEAYRQEQIEKQKDFWKGHDEKNADAQAEIDFLMQERNELQRSLMEADENTPQAEYEEKYDRFLQLNDQIARLEAEAAGDARNFDDDDAIEMAPDEGEDMPWGWPKEDSDFSDLGKHGEESTLDEDIEELRSRGFDEDQIEEFRRREGARDSKSESWKDEIDPETKKRALGVLRQVLDRTQRGGRRDPNYSEIADAFDAAGLPSEDNFIREITQAFRDDLELRGLNMTRFGQGTQGTPRNRVFGRHLSGPHNKPTERPELEGFHRSTDFLDRKRVEDMGVRGRIKEGPAAPEGPILGQPRNRMDPMGGFSMNEGFGALKKIPWQQLKKALGWGNPKMGWTRKNFLPKRVLQELAEEEVNPNTLALAYAESYKGYAAAAEAITGHIDRLRPYAMNSPSKEIVQSLWDAGIILKNYDRYVRTGEPFDDVLAGKTGMVRHPILGRLDPKDIRNKGPTSWRPEYEVRSGPGKGNTFFSDFGALDKGVEVLRKGARSYKRWREAMRKEGVNFDTAKQAKQAWRDTLKGYDAIFEDGVINVEKYALDVSGSRHLAEIAARHRELKESQAESKSGLLGEARDFANRLGFEYDRLDVDKAKALTGREIKYREIAIEENMKAMESASEMLVSLPDDLRPEVRQFIDAVERQTNNLLHDVILGAGQKGRDLNMLKALSARVESPSFWAIQAKKHLGPETPLTWDVEAEIMKLVNNLRQTKRGTQPRKDAELALTRRVRRLSERHWAQQIADLFKAAITPLGVVDVANFATNTSVSGVKTVDQTFSAFIEKMVAPLFFGGRRTVMSPFARGSGAKRIEALRNAKIVGKGTMRGGADPTLGGKFAAQHGEITLFPRKVNHWVNKYLDFHWRRFGAADAAQREYVMVLSLWNDALARATNEGFKGKELSKRAEQLFRDFDVLMAANATERATTATFTKENQVADFLTLGRSKLTPGIKAGSHVAIPFAKTLANVAEMTLDYTPVVGLAKSVIGIKRSKRAMKGRQLGEKLMNEAKGGSVEKLAQRQAADRERVAEEAQRKLIEALGRQMSGLGVIGIGFLLALQDKLTGYGPTTRAEREHWEAEGRQAMSAKINGKWRRYDRIVGPMAPLLALGAEAFKTAEELKRDDPGVTTGDRVKRVARGFTGTVVESAPGGSLTIFGRRQTADPEGSFLSGTATSALNVLGVGRVAEASDPHERRTENFKERLQSRIPWARQQLPVKTTATGEPVRNETRGVAMFDPTRPRRDRSTPVLREMRRLGVEMTRPSDKGTYTQQQQMQRLRAGETETRVPEQYDRPREEVDRIAQLSGPRITEKLEKLMARTAYQKWDDGQRKRAIQSIMNEERARADRLVTREYRRQGTLPGEQ